MGETNIPVTSGAGNAVDVFSLPNSNLRQSVVVGDSAIAGNVAPVQATDPSSNAFGVVVRDVNTSAIVSKLSATIAVSLDPGHTLGTVIANAGSGSFTVQFDPGHELGSIKQVNTTVTIKTDPGYTLGSIQNINTTVTVKFDPGYTLGKVDQGAGQTTSAWFVNAAHTASIFTASGSASGISVSGNTIISPSGSYNFKIYAFSVMTTGAVSLTCKLTNGSGGSPTEFFRPLVTAGGVTGVQGSNMAMTPPGYLFATGTSTTLALVLDSASLVHYSVSYIKESA